MGVNARGRIQRRAGLNLGWAVRVLVLVTAILALSKLAFAQESAPSRPSQTPSPPRRGAASAEAFDWTAVGSFLCDCAAAVGLGNLRLVAGDGRTTSFTVIPTEETRATWKQLRALMLTIERAGAGLAFTEVAARAAPEEPRDGRPVRRWKFDATVTAARRAAVPSAFEGLYRVLRAIADTEIETEVVTEAVWARAIPASGGEPAHVEVRLLLLAAGPEPLVAADLECLRTRIEAEAWCCEASIDRLSPLRGGAWWDELVVRLHVDDDERQSFLPGRVVPPGAANER